MAGFASVETGAPETADDVGAEAAGGEPGAEAASGAGAAAVCAAAIPLSNNNTIIFMRIILIESHSGMAYLFDCLEPFEPISSG